MAGTTPVLSVRSFSMLGRSGIERVGTVWLTGIFSALSIVFIMDCTITPLIVIFVSYFIPYCSS